MNPLSRRPKALIFDLDNTLTHRGKSIEAFAQYFVNRYASQLSTDSAAAVTRLIKQIDNGGYGCPANPSSSIKRSIAIRLRRELRWNEAPLESELFACWFEQFPRHAISMEGASDIVHWAKQNGIKCAVISNGNDASRQATVLALNLVPMFDEIISSEAFDAKKPHPSIFHHCLASLKVDAQDAVFVGDHPTIDIAGAQGIGMKTAWVKGFHPWPAAAKQADYEVENMADLHGLLQNPVLV